MPIKPEDCGLARVDDQFAYFIAGVHFSYSPATQQHLWEIILVNGEDYVIMEELVRRWPGNEKPPYDEALLKLHELDENGKPIQKKTRKRKKEEYEEED